MGPSHPSVASPRHGPLNGFAVALGEWAGVKWSGDEWGGSGGERRGVGMNLRLCSGSVCWDEWEWSGVKW